MVINLFVYLSFLPMLLSTAAVGATTVTVIEESEASPTNSNKPAIVLTGNNTCSILSFFPTHHTTNTDDATTVTSSVPPKPYKRWNDLELARVSASYLAAATMAVNHFNHRNTSLIPELAHFQNCPVKLSLDVIDEWLDEKTGTQLYLDKSRETCAILDTYDMRVARAMQPLSVALEQPQVIYSWLDPFLTNEYRPTCIGMVPGILPRARALAEYLNAFEGQQRREFVAVIYQEAYTSSYISQCFQEDAADKYGLVSIKYQDDHFGVVRGNQTDEGVQRKVLASIRESGMRTIFINKLDSEGLNLTAHLLDEYNMLTDDYVYVFHSIAVPTDTIGLNNVFGPLQHNSPMDKLLRGGLVMDHMDPFRMNATNVFLEHWKSQSPEELDLQDHLPQDYFTTAMPTAYSSLLFDGIIALGLGACNVVMANATDNNNQDGPTVTTTTPTSFRDFILQTHFSGVSGSVEWGCYGASRCNPPMMYGMYNIRSKSFNDTHSSYDSVLTAIWNEKDRWYSVSDVFYRSGASTPPTLLRQPQDENLLSQGTRIFGWVLFATAAFLAVLGVGFVLLLRKDASIVKAQPLFLILLCLGAFIISLSILTLSFDEGLSITQQGLDIACTMTTWFFFVGYALCFAALAAKMWRIDHVLQFRPRQRVLTETRAMIPVGIFLGVTILLLSLWTALDPWTWKRETIEMIPYTIYGECHSDHFWAFFGPLMAWIVVAQTLTLVYANKTSDIHEDYRDSELSHYAIATQCQSWIVGVPILAVLGNASSDAVFVSRALLLWILSLSNTLIVVGPKVFCALQRRHHKARHPEEHSSTSVRISGIPGMSSCPSKNSYRGFKNASRNSDSFPHSSTTNEYSDEPKLGACEVSQSDAPK